MNDTSETVSQQCRLCSSNSFLFHLNKKRGLKIRKLIEFTIGIKIEEDDYYNNVCLNCVTFICNIHIFKENSLIVAKKLQDSLRERTIHQSIKSPVITMKDTSVESFCEDISSLVNWVKDRRECVLKQCTMQKTNKGINVKPDNLDRAVQTEVCAGDFNNKLSNPSLSSCAVQTEPFTMNFSKKPSKSKVSECAVQTEPFTMNFSKKTVKSKLSECAVQTEPFTMNFSKKPLKSKSSKCTVQIEPCTMDSNKKLSNREPSNCAVQKEPGNVDLNNKLSNVKPSDCDVQNELGKVDVNNKLSNVISPNRVGIKRTAKKINNIKKKLKLDSKPDPPIELPDNVNNNNCLKNCAFEIKDSETESNNLIEIPEINSSTPKHKSIKSLCDALTPIKLEVASPMTISSDSISIKTSPVPATPVSCVSENIMIPYKEEVLVSSKVSDAAMSSNNVKRKRIIRRCSICKKIFHRIKDLQDHRAECLGLIMRRTIRIPLVRLEKMREAIKSPVTQDLETRTLVSNVLNIQSKKNS